MRIRHKLLLFLSRNYCKQWRTQIIRGYFKKLNFHGVISSAGLFTIARTMAHLLPNIDKDKWNISILLLLPNFEIDLQDCSMSLKKFGQFLMISTNGHFIRGFTTSRRSIHISPMFNQLFNNSQVPLSCYHMQRCIQ